LQSTAPLNRPGGRLWRVWLAVTRPWPACLIFNATLLVWHVPALYNTTLTVVPLHISMLRINLGPTALHNDAVAFSTLLIQDDRRRFAHRTWEEALEDAAPVPPWLAAYVRRVGIPLATDA